MCNTMTMVADNNTNKRAFHIIRHTVLCLHGTALHCYAQHCTLMHPTDLIDGSVVVYSISMNIVI